MAARKIRRLRDIVAAMVVSGRQIRAARALTGLSQKELADRVSRSVPGVSLSVPGLAKIESGKSNPLAKNLDAIVRVLEAAGVEFTNDTGGEPSLRLRPGVRLPETKPKPRGPRK